MELVEIEHEVTDYLVHALELSDRPPAAMAYCRLATECITHNLHYREHGEYPSPRAGKGEFPSLAGIITRVVNSLQRQTGEVLYSINAQSRGSLHWNFETRGEVVKSHHVESVITQISNTFTDVFGTTLSLSGISLSDKDVEQKANIAVSSMLTQQGFDQDSSPLEEEVDKSQTDDILELAQAVKDRGAEFGPWECIRLGNASILRVQVNQAELYFEEAMQILKDGPIRRGGSRDMLNGEAACMEGKGDVAKLRGDFDEAERLYRESLAIARQTGNQVREMTSLNELGNIQRRRGDLDGAESLYRESLAIALENGNREREKSSLNNLGIIAKQRGDLDGAEELYRNALALAHEIGDREKEYSHLNNLGVIAELRGDLDGAEGLHLEALAIAREYWNPYNESFSLNHLGDITEQRGDLDGAESLYRESLAIARETGNQTREVRSLNNLGNIQRRRGDLDGAESLCRESLAIAREMDNKIELSKCLNNLGRATLKCGNLDEAERLHNEALTIDREMGNREGEAQELARLGRIALERGDHEVAEKLYRDSVSIMNELGRAPDKWLIENGYTEPDEEWDFPPKD